jgi:hypothetical protein
MANADILNFLQELQRIFLECGVCAEVYNEDGIAYTMTGILF